jgi:hypothetical protein
VLGKGRLNSRSYRELYLCTARTSCQPPWWTALSQAVDARPLNTLECRPACRASNGTRASGPSRAKYKSGGTHANPVIQTPWHKGCTGTGTNGSKSLIESPHQAAP